MASYIIFNDNKLYSPFSFLTEHSFLFMVGSIYVRFFCCQQILFNKF